MNTHRRLAAVVAAGALMLAGCGSDAKQSAPDNAADSKTGGGTDPIVITVADSEPQGRPSNLPLAEFARQVESLSDGSMNIEIVTDAGGDADPGGDQAVIEQLRQGGFEMAVLPARAWSAAGVSSMQPLQTPFLVESDDHLDAVVSDEPVVEALLAGLDGVGVHGLTMFPESLRHLFSYTTPILTPQDVVGRQVRYVASPEVAAMITALGATPVDPPGDEFGTGVADGTITATDSGYSIALSSAIRPAIATGNVVLYAKAITLVANTAFWDELTDAERQALNTAAAKTREWAIANRVDENAAAAEYCAGGGAVVLAQPEQVDKFRDAVAPMYAELEHDATTKNVIADIDALAPTSTSMPVTACGSVTSDVPSELRTRWWRPSQRRVPRRDHAGLPESARPERPRREQQLRNPHLPPRGRPLVGGPCGGDELLRPGGQSGGDLSGRR